MSCDRIDSAEAVDNARRYERELVEWIGTPRRREWIIRILYVLLALNLFALGLYLFHGYQNYFHTDASTKNLLAQEMWETGQFFPRDWNYANRDLMVVFGQILIWPLLAFFKNGFALHAVSGLLFSAAILASLWKLTALFCEARWQRVLVLAVFSGGISLKTAENIFGQVSYGVVLLLSSVVVLVAWRAMQAPNRRAYIAPSVMAVVIFLATWGNPQRALISYVIPVLVAICVHILFGGPVGEVRQRLRGGVPVFLAIGLGVSIGAVRSSLVISEVQNSNNVAAARWLDYDGFVHNFVHSAQVVMAMFGGVPPAGGEVVSLEGAYASLRLLVAVPLLFLLPWAVVRAFREGGAVLKFFAVFVAVQLSATLFLFVTTTIPDMSDPMTSGRYLAPPVLLCLLLLFCLRLQREHPIRSAIVIGLMCVLATNSIVRLGHEAMPVRSHNAQQMAVVGALRANRLEYGYGSYWNSGVYTVLSDGDSRVRQIQIVDGLPIPMRHLGSNRWYESDVWKGSTFLLLDGAEEAKVNWNAMRARMGMDPRRVHVGHLTAFVYPMNIAEKMPLWSRSFDRAVTFPVSPDSMRNQGRWDEASKAVLSFKGEKGFLAYGPYMHLPSGRYRAEFRISATGAEGGDGAVVDVVYDGGRSVVASLPVKGASTDVSALEFELAKPADMIEMRVRATGAADVTYRGVTLYPIGKGVKNGS